MNAYDPDADHRVIPLPGPVQKESLDHVKFDPQLPQDRKSELYQVLQQFQNTFTDVPKRTNVIECEIKLTSDDPVRSKTYPVLHSTREIIQQEVRNMLDMGIIERSNSSYSSPVVLVPKKDQSVRFCIDYRKLNRIIVFDTEPMPNPEEMFALLAKGKYLSKIDMTKGYWQIPMAQDSKGKTSFVTLDGQFQFVVMPFGLVNSGQTFTRMVRKLFGNVPNVVFYIDDVQIYTESWEEHVKTVKHVLQILEKANLAIRPSKCIFACRNIEFLGHQVGRGSLACLLKKIQNCERPTTKKQIQSFIGLTGYYRKFVPNYSDIALPLTDLTRKGCPSKVVWGEAQEKSYQTLKFMLVKAPVLKLPDFSKQFIIQTDTSDTGMGAVLLQDHFGILHLIMPLRSCFHGNTIIPL